MTSYGPGGPVFGPTRGPQTLRGAVVVAMAALGVLFALSFPVAALLVAVAAVATRVARTLSVRAEYRSRRDRGGRRTGAVDGSPRRREPAD